MRGLNLRAPADPENSKDLAEHHETPGTNTATFTPNVATNDPGKYTMEQCATSH